MAHTSRGKDFAEYDNPYNVGMTGIIGATAGYHAVLDCGVRLLLGADFAWPQLEVPQCGGRGTFVPAARRR